MYKGIVSHSSPPQKKKNKKLMLTHFSCGVGVRAIYEREKKLICRKAWWGGEGGAGLASQGCKPVSCIHTWCKAKARKPPPPLPSEPSSRFCSYLNGTLMASAGAAPWVGGWGGWGGLLMVRWVKVEEEAGSNVRSCGDSSYLRVLTRREAFVWIYFFPPFDLRSARLCGAGAVIS